MNPNSCKAVKGGLKMKGFRYSGDSSQVAWYNRSGNDVGRAYVGVHGQIVGGASM